MIKEVTFVVNVPVEEVFAFLGDLENNLKWRPGQIEARKLSAGPIGVGTTYRMVNSALGRRLEGEAEVTEYEPNRKFTSVGKAGFMPIVAQRIFEPVEGGTWVTFIATAEPRGFLELAQPLLARRARAPCGHTLGASTPRNPQSPAHRRVRRRPVSGAKCPR